MLAWKRGKAWLCTSGGFQVGKWLALIAACIWVALASLFRDGSPKGLWFNSRSQHC